MSTEPNHAVTAISVLEQLDRSAHSIQWLNNAIGLDVGPAVQLLEQQGLVLAIEYEDVGGVTGVCVQRVDRIGSRNESPREKAVAMSKAGYKTKRIAEETGLAENTVREYIRHERKRSGEN